MSFGYTVYCVWVCNCRLFLCVFSVLGVVVLVLLVWLSLLRIGLLVWCGGLDGFGTWVWYC